jgi:signal peptidase II
VRHGYVIDFINAHWEAAYFPAFNVADSCITVGAGLIFLDALLEWRRERRVRKGQVD